MIESFISKGQAELKAFYNPYFNTDTELEAFLFDALDYENGSISKRQMLYQVQRFVSLANDIDKLRPGRDCLRMLFIKICLESLCSLSGYTERQKNLFYDKFVDCFSEIGEQYILNHFWLSSFDDECFGHVFEVEYEISLIDFFELIKVARDLVVHEGRYWEIQFFAYDDNSIWVVPVTTKKRILKSYNYQSKEKRNATYHFQTTLNYEKFIFFFVEACVNYIKSICSEKRIGDRSLQ
ncbi:MAG: hypothetical protein E7464_06590 [Ruminococcaceae bacterium]|nr:hypothetical protein [Oscillospiraceae bacterium]